MFKLDSAPDLLAFLASALIKTCFYRESTLCSPHLLMKLFKFPWTLFFKSIQFSLSVVSDSLWPHGLQHARLPCPPLSPGICSNSCLLSRWCYPIISSSASPFSFCLQSFSVSGSFPRSQFFESGGQSIGASASFLPINIQSRFPLGLTGFDLLVVQGTLNSLLQHHNSKTSILWCSVFFMVQLSHPYVTTRKP